MKKIITTILSITLVISMLSGCSITINTDSEPTAVPSTPAPTENKKELAKKDYDRLECLLSAFISSFVNVNCNTFEDATSDDLPETIKKDMADMLGTESLEDFEKSFNLQELNDAPIYYEYHKDFSSFEINIGSTFDPIKIEGIEFKIDNRDN